MLVFGVAALADGFTGQERLGIVAALLGILVFGVIVLVAERRDHRREALPPRAARDVTSIDPPRKIQRGPAVAVPIASAREAAVVDAPVGPYPVPFVTGDDPVPAAPGPESP